MKKTAFLLSIAFLAFGLVRAQLPDHWTDDTDIEIFQEADNAFGGAYSAGVIVNSGTQANCDFQNEVIIPVAAGDSYKISFWGNTSVAVRARAVFLWEGASTSYSNEYLGPDTGEWMEFVSEGVVPDGATGVRLGIRFYDVSGFTPGEVQYIDDVTFESPAGTALTVSNGDFETWPGLNPEPADYPEDFTGTAAGLNAILSWVDPSNGQLPENYLIKASTQDNITNPEDGIYVSDDLNLSDGTGAANVGYGVETFTFSNLNPQTVYYFKIFPYTNAGTNIDYKNDGTPPAAMVEISSVVVIESENFDASWGNWTPMSVLGDEVWDRENSFGVNGTPCAQITGYNSGTTFANEDWLISPSMDLTQYENELLSFYSAVGYITEDDQFAVRISQDYDGSGNPNDFTWTGLDPVLPDGSSNWVWTASGELDISGFDGDNVHIAFVYFCETDDAATWEVDEIMITGEGEVVVSPEPSNYPTAFAAMAAGTTINISWTDATGETMPEGYLVVGSDQDNIALPVDGTPVADDAGLSDGSGALNILPGIQSASFSGLTAGMTYYFKVFPYTNSGSLIDYKTDGTPPAAQATTEMTTDILYTDFNDNWGGWTPVSLVGEQTWRRDNEYGIENTPCALMSGFSGGAVENEDWLISPALNLSASTDEVVRFYSATNYDGPALQFLISTDYNGTGNPNDFTWTDLSGLVTWSPGGFDWTLSGDIDISGYADENVYLAFLYFSTTAGAANWEIDNVKVTQAEAAGEPSNYPTDFTVTAVNQSVIVSWTDATGEIVPTGYVVLISDSPDFTLPEDGTPVADDTDLNDGSGAINLMPGTEQYTFTGLMENTTYNAVIIPYTNSGSLIDYKTDGIPPTGSATTQEAAPDLLYTTFDESWENWTPISVAGDQIWDRDNSYGVEGTPCARMSGFSGEAFDNEDWLISPAIDLTNTVNETLEFYSAVGYSGPGLQFLISTTFDGTGNPNDFQWDNLTDQAQWPAGDPFWEWTPSGTIDLSAYTNEIIHIAFIYTSNTSDAATWEVDNIRVQGEGNSIGEIQHPLVVNLYPNPGNGILYFDADESVASIEVFNLAGLKVYEADATGQNGQLNLANLGKGIYMVRFAAGEKLMTKRIVIQ
jgi:hypothetical protein